MVSPALFLPFWHNLCFDVIRISSSVNFNLTTRSRQVGRAITSRKTNTVFEGKKVGSTPKHGTHAGDYHNGLPGQWQDNFDSEFDPPTAANLQGMWCFLHSSLIQVRCASQVHLQKKTTSAKTSALALKPGIPPSLINFLTILSASAFEKWIWRCGRRLSASWVSVDLRRARAPQWLHLLQSSRPAQRRAVPTTWICRP